MDQNESTPVSSRKVRFAPKVPPLKKPKPVRSKKLVDEEDKAQGVQDLLRHVNANGLVEFKRVKRSNSYPFKDMRSSGHRGLKWKKHVVFGPGAATIRSFGVPRDGSSDKSSGLELRDPASDNGETALSSPSAKRDDTKACSTDADNDSAQIRKKYKAPCDSVTYGPMSIPWRDPHSGDPESGDASTRLEYDENTINAASELGLLEESDTRRMFFFQLHAILPSVKQAAGAKGKETVGNSLFMENIDASIDGKEIPGSSISRKSLGTSAKGKEVARSSRSLNGLGTSEHSCELEELPGGCMGKMLVYKSGAIKLRLGEILFDVSPGSKKNFDEQAVVISTVDKQFCVIDNLGPHVVVSPDFDLP